MKVSAQTNSALRRCACNTQLPVCVRKIPPKKAHTHKKLESQPERIHSEKKHKKIAQSISWLTYNRAVVVHPIHIRRDFAAASHKQHAKQLCASFGYNSREEKKETQNYLMRRV